MKNRNLVFSLYVIILTCFVYVQNEHESSNPCGSTRLPCDDFQCIKREKWCDKIQDCIDGSDEKYCKFSKWSYARFRFVSPHTCSQEIHYECNEGPCIPLAARCDGFTDCKDESDEIRCENSSTESSTASSTDWDPFDDFSKFTSTASDTTTPSIQLSNSEDITSKNKFTVKTPEIISTSVSRHDKPRTQSTTVTSTFDNKEDPKSLNSPRTTPGSRNRNVSPTRTTGTKQSAPSPTSGYVPSTTEKNRLNSHQNHKNAKPTIPIRIRSTRSQLHNYSTSKTKKYRKGTTPMDYYYSRHQAENPYGTPTREPEIVGIHVRMTHDMNTKQVVYPENSELRSGRTEFSRKLYPNEQQQISKVPIDVQLRRNYVHSTKVDAPRVRTHALLSVKKSTGVLSPFHFSKNYSEEFDYRYVDNIQLAERYLIEKRDSYSWGKDSPRALIALSLISNSFMSNDPEKNLMKKKLEADLGTKLLKLKSEPSSMSNSKLASYINALMATCQNPKDFFGQDLIQLLSDRRISPNLNEKPMNPFVILTLCLNNFTISWDELHDLRSMALASRETQSEADKDIQILATTALSCYQHYKGFENTLNSSVGAAFLNIIEMGHEDGSFGSLHSTALAAQSLMSMSSSIPITWDAQKTVDYLVDHQEEDGYFGDMLGTYLALTAMTGRSLLHLRNTKCDPLPNKTSVEEDLNVHGPKISIHYTLKVGYPETSTISMVMNVPQGSNFLEIMKMAAKLNPRFRFMYDEEPGNLHVHTIFGIPNDPELGSRWHLYIVNGSGPEFFTIDLQGEEFPHDIRNLKPLAYQELIYWYLSI